MGKIKISGYFTCKNGLDDRYTLYNDGSVTRVYDKHMYPGVQDLEFTFDAQELKQEIKGILLDKANEENKELAKEILGL
ncbi:hypothetical protein [Empedobacter tilapiae]|uniref:hypothetical protein n=1 Tax=Empedobacter tilapiae TaxID=2491114 RepID=UPI0028D4C409|nr:hypothetical protein [Empedobacter tilapiae]